MYYLDTKTCIFFLNGKHPSIRSKLLSTSPREIAIPSLVKVELILGAYKSKQKESNVERVEIFLEPFEIIPFENEMSYVYAEIRADIEKRGVVISPTDLIIATIAKYKNAILVTNIIKEFKRIKGLLIEDWVQ